MNWGKLKQGWGRYKKRAVGERIHLKEINLNLIAGNRTQLIELLQDKYSMSQEEATQTANNWAESVTGD